MDFLTTENLIIIPVIVGIGYALKTAQSVDDRYIPSILIVVGAILGLFNGYTFNNVLQGIICSTVAMGIYDTGRTLYKVRGGKYGK